MLNPQWKTAMADWFAESDSVQELSLPRRKRSPDDRKMVGHYINDRPQGEFFHNLASLRRCDQLCDVLLEAVGGSGTENGTEAEQKPTITIAAHRVVLAAASPFFRGMFTSDMKESKSEKVILKEMDGPTLSALIDYLYTGHLEIHENNVQNLLQTSCLLQLHCVRDACSRFLLDQLDTSNCLGIAAIAKMLNCVQLANHAQTFTQQHFRELIASEELLSMDLESFYNLIKDDRLTTEGEEAVFEAVMNWVKFDLPLRAAHLPKVLSAVRLPLLTKDFLFKSVHDDPLVKASSECKDILLNAFRCLLSVDKTENELVLSDSLSYTVCWSRPRQPVPISQLLTLVGGQAPKAIANVDTLDPDSLRWSNLSSLPQRRCRCGVTQRGDHVYAIGGFNGSQRVATVDVYDSRIDTWISGPPMNARRSTLGLCVLDGVMVAVGGFDGNSGLCSAEMLDPRQGQWIPMPSMATRRSSVGVAAMGGLIYAVGGYDGHSRQCLNTVEIYDPRAMAWRVGPCLLEVRSGAGVVVCKDQLVAVGGHDGPLVHKSVEVLHGDNWEVLPEMTVCRRNAGVIATNGQIFAVGGDDGATNLASIEKFEMFGPQRSAELWTPLQTQLAQPRSYSGLALLPKN